MYLCSLRRHENTKNFFKDKGFVKKLEDILTDTAKMKEYLFEPRIMQCVGVLTGIEMPKTSVQRQYEKDEMVISSEEEDSSEDEDDSDDDVGPFKVKQEPLPKPISVTKRRPPVDRDATRQKLAEAMNMSLEDLDKTFAQLHKPKVKLEGGSASVAASTATDDLAEPAMVAAAAKLATDVAPASGAAAPPAKKSSKVPKPAAPGAVTAASVAAAGPDSGPAAGTSRSGKSPDAVTGSVAARNNEALEVESDDEPLPPLEIPEGDEDRKARSLDIKADAAAAYKAKRFRRAIALYDRCLELDGTNMVFELNKGAVHLEINRLDACIRDCEAAIALGTAQEADPKLIAKAHARIAKAHAGRENFDAAIKASKVALEIHRCKEHLEAKNLYLQLKAQKTEAEYRDPLKAQGAKARGNDFYKKGKYPEAVREYTDAIARDPDNAFLISRVYSNRAACYSKMGEVLRSVQDCDACIKADPNFVKGYLRKGNLLNKIEQYEDAILAFKKVLALDPHSFDGRRGLETAEKGRNIKSQTHADKAKEAMEDIKIQEIWESSRDLLQKMMDPEQADSYEVRKALDDPEIRKNLDILRRAGVLN